MLRNTVLDSNLFKRIAGRGGAFAVFREERSLASMLALIAAYAKNRVIGCGGVIPWKIPGEQTRFRELTTGAVVILGRRSFEEIGKPLPNRTTIVLSKTQHFSDPHCLTARSLSEALTLAQGRDCFLAGGEGIYRQGLPLADVLYLTELEQSFSGDTFFPEFDTSAFQKTEDRFVPGSIPYRYVTYVRKEVFSADSETQHRS